MSEARGQAVLTGASSGIGAALAPRLAAAGYDLLLVARRAEKLSALAASIRSAHPERDVRVLGLDVSTDVALEALLAEAPAPSLLVNNAGVGLFGSATAHPVEDQAHVVRLNCEALTTLTLGYLPGMLERGRGVIVNLASIAGFQPVPFFAVYGATKAYVLSLTEALDEEVAGSGVRLVAVCPGPVPTEFQGKAGSPDAMHTPSIARRTPDEVAEACMRAIARPRRLVVPAPFHRWMWWFQRFVPRGTVTAIAANKMRKRQG